MQRWLPASLSVRPMLGLTAVTQVSGVMLMGQVSRLLSSSLAQTEHTFLSELLPYWGSLLNFRVGLDRNKPSNNNNYNCYYFGEIDWTMGPDYETVTWFVK